MSEDVLKVRVEELQRRVEALEVHLGLEAPRRRDAEPAPTPAPAIDDRGLDSMDRDERARLRMLCSIQARGEVPGCVPLNLPMWCPFCGEQHIDEGEWATRVHHTHRCLRCGGKWTVRPAVFGVKDPVIEGVRFGTLAPAARLRAEDDAEMYEQARASHSAALGGVSRAEAERRLEESGCEFKVVPEVPAFDPANPTHVELHDAAEAASAAASSATARYAPAWARLARAAVAFAGGRVQELEGLRDVLRHEAKCQRERADALEKARDGFRAEVGKLLGRVADLESVLATRTTTMMTHMEQHAALAKRFVALEKERDQWAERARKAEAALEDAVRAEREACAKVADALAGGPATVLGERIAAKIRERGGNPGITGRSAGGVMRPGPVQPAASTGIEGQGGALPAGQAVE